MKKSQPQQSREVSLETFCLSLARLYRQNPSLVSGALMAELTKRLIAAESQPGGPYYSENYTLDFTTNLAIAYLFTCLKMPLPNLTAFITANRSSAPSSSKQLLYTYDQYFKNTPKKHAARSSEHRAIFAATKKYLARLPQPEKPLALAFLEKINQADASQEIALIPTFFAKSLISPPPSPPTHQLGQANIFCWIAYSIYDQLIDEGSDIQQLPIANTAMRESLTRYQTLFAADHPFQQTILSTFNAMDHANAWELTNCRFKRAGEDIILADFPRYGTYKIIADRSSGHILGPLAITTLCDVSTETYTHIEKGLRHYLIARQLSDDIHDWKEDFTAGHISSTVSYLLQQLGVRPGTHSSTSLQAAMQAIFWQDAMKNFTAIIVRHIHHSRRHLLKSGMLSPAGPVFALHDRLETIANQSLAEYHTSKDFLSSYSLTANDSRLLPQSLRP